MKSDMFVFSVVIEFLFMYHVIRCEIFTKLTELLSHFTTGQLLKFEWIRSSGSGVMGVRLRGPVSPKFLALPRGETLRPIPKCF